MIPYTTPSKWVGGNEELSSQLNQRFTAAFPYEDALSVRITQLLVSWTQRWVAALL